MYRVGPDLSPFCRLLKGPIWLAGLWSHESLIRYQLLSYWRQTFNIFSYAAPDKLTIYVVNIFFLKESLNFKYQISIFYDLFL